MLNFPDASFPARLTVIMLVALSISASCTGYVEGTASAGAPAASLPSGPAVAGISGVVPDGAAAPQLAKARVRRLSVGELRNSVEDVFLAGAKLDASWSGGTPRHEFDNVFDALDLGVGFAEEMQVAAEETAQRFVSQLGATLPCSQAVSGSELDCARELIEVYGRRAYRRPPSEAERVRLLALFQSARERHDVVEAFGVVVEAMIQSPYFVFRTELGSVPGVVAAPLSPYEVASAMSYAAWRSAPDDALLDAARDGRLASAPQIQEQFVRLLQGPRAAASVRDFFSQLLETNLLRNGISKADPSFTPEQAETMAKSVDALVDRVVWAEQGSFASLLTSADGVLTQPGFLTVQSSPSGFSPIFLGLFVRTKLLCQPLASPPPGVPAPSKDPSLSTRERFRLHSESPSCIGCHALMDPIGFGFERYDELGRYRESETVEGRVIALTGQGTLGQVDVASDFTGPQQLGQLLSQSEEVAACFASHLLRFVLGRNTGTSGSRLEGDQQSLAAVLSVDSAKDIKSIMTNLVATPAFLYRDMRDLPGGP